MQRMRYPSARPLLGGALALLVVVMVQGTALAAGPKLKTFATPEAAVQSLVKAVQDNNTKALRAILGPGSETLLSSGDPIEDRQGREKFIQFYGEKNRLETARDKRVVLHVGDNDWPFPIPLVKTDTHWRFDTQQGREEILSRRVGRNELAAIQTCLAIVDAQREYAAVDRDGDGLQAYAVRFESAKGKKDGLHWKSGPSEELSPLGPLVARALSEGYTQGATPAPYQGYFFRILKSQGKNAQGGAYSYLAKGKMIGGFGIVAYPARYGASGIKTFIVNHTGVVYQKDLGPQTVKKAQAMKAFDPDKTWEKSVF